MASYYLRCESLLNKDFLSTKNSECLINFLHLTNKRPVLPLSPRCVQCHTCLCDSFFECVFLFIQIHSDSVNLILFKSNCSLWSLIQLNLLQYPLFLKLSLFLSLHQIVRQMTSFSLIFLYFKITLNLLS